MEVLTMGKPVKPERFATVGEWMRFNRENERYSLKAMADEFGKSHTWLNRIEKGEIRATREIIERIATLTRVDPDEGLRLLSEAEMGGKDVLDFLPPSEQSLVRAFREDPVFRQAAQRMIGQRETGETQLPLVDDQRTAAEREQGVPAMTEKRPTVKPDVPRGPRKEW